MLMSNQRPFCAIKLVKLLTSVTGKEQLNSFFYHLIVRGKALTTNQLYTCDQHRDCLGLKLSNTAHQQGTVQMLSF